MLLARRGRLQPVFVLPGGNSSGKLKLPGERTLVLCQISTESPDAALHCVNFEVHKYRK